MRRFLVVLLLAACADDEPAFSFAGRDVDAWAAALEDPDQTDAARAELEKGGQDAVPVLAGVIGTKTRRARLIAMELVARLGPEAAAAVPALRAALKDKDTGFRGFAATALGRIGEAARPALLDLEFRLRDPDAGVRVMAALAVFGIAREPKTAMEVLLRALRSRNTRLRKLAASGFSELGELAVSPLIASLMDPAPAVRAAAATALGHIGAAAGRAKPMLEQSLKDEESEVRLAAREALARIG